MDPSILETLAPIIGDTPVSVQICAALEPMASINYVRDNYVTLDDFEELKRQFEALAALIGDMSVSEQIFAALKNSK